MKIETAPQYKRMVYAGIERKNRGLIGAEEVPSQTRATPYYTTINMYPHGKKGGHGQEDNCVGDGHGTAEPKGRHNLISKSHGE
eukprot:3126396-Ditylum_brightwellii.AAC.1